MRDIIIVGAGIAGQVLCRELALSGIPSVLIDNRSFPREKVCGGVLQWDSWQYLDSLFSLPKPQVLSHIGHYWGRKFLSRHSLKHPMVTMPRIALDSFLNGTNHAKNQKISEKALVIRADGAEKKKGDWIGFQAEVPGTDAPELQMFYGKGIYLGSVPLNDGKRHAAFVMKKNLFSGILSLKEKIKEEFGMEVSEIKGSSVIDYRHVSQDLAVGDAKMPTHPFLGFGMKHAILSARLMASHIRSGTLERYASDHVKLFWRSRIANQLSGALFDSPFRALLKPALSSRPLFNRFYFWLHS